MSQFKVISIDGGAASGKSSTSRGVAEKLNFFYVDTGSHYRAVAALLMKKGAFPEEDEKIREILGTIDLGAKLDGYQGVVALDGKEFSKNELRSDDVNAHISQYAANGAIRGFLKGYQRGLCDFAKANGFNGIVMEGRDIGSVILPDADYKFFLEADEATRERRRLAEGQVDAIAARDEQDKSRETAPLRCPEGAMRVDNSNMTLEEVIELIVDKVE